MQHLPLHLLPVGPVHCPLSLGKCNRSLTGCLDPCSLLSLSYAAAEVILFVCWLIQTPLAVSYLTLSQKQVWRTASETIPGPAPALSSCSDVMSCFSPRARSVWARWPLCSFPGRRTSSNLSVFFTSARDVLPQIRIKAFLSSVFQYPAQVSSYHRSLPDHAS